MKIPQSPGRPVLRVHNKRWFAGAWLLATFVFLGLTMLALQARNSDQNRAVVVAEEFVLAMQTGDADKAYALGGPSFRQAISKTALDDAFAGALPLLARSTISKSDEYFTMTAGGPRAVVVYLAQADSRQLYIRLIVEKRQGDWQVYSLQTSSNNLRAKP